MIKGAGQGGHLGEFELIARYFAPLANDAAAQLLAQARYAGAHALILRAVTLDGATIAAGFGTLLLIGAVIAGEIGRAHV